MMAIYAVSIKTPIGTAEFHFFHNLKGDNQLLYSRQPVHTVDA